MVEKAYRLIFGIILCMSAVFFAAPCAYSEPLALISDAETQNYLSEVVKPLFKAAGLPFDENKIMLVNDNSLNAFVSDGNYLFINTGTLTEVDNTNELSGVLAHEGAYFRRSYRAAKIEDKENAICFNGLNACRRSSRNRHRTR